MKQSEKYTKSGQTGGRGGILWGGDITDETQTGEGRSAASFVTSLRAGGTVFPKKPRPGSLFPSIVSLSAASVPLQPLYEPQKKKKKNQAAEALVFVVSGEESTNSPSPRSEQIREAGAIASLPWLKEERLHLENPQPCKTRWRNSELRSGLQEGADQDLSELSQRLCALCMQHRGA